MQLPPPSSFPRPMKASVSPSREPLPHTFFPSPPAYRGVEVPVAAPVIPTPHPAEVNEAVRAIHEERNVLASALKEATLDGQVLSRRLADEEAGHALSLRQGQEALAQARSSCESRLSELESQVTDLRATMQTEREAHLERMRVREEEHIAALQAERQVGGERLGQMSKDTQDAVSIVQEQVVDIQQALEEQRRAGRETAERLMETQRRLQEAQDENTRQKALMAKVLEDHKVREQHFSAAQLAADEAGEMHVRECTVLKITVAELEERVLDLQRNLVQEKHNREAAEVQCLRAEKIVQESAQTATASELLALQSQKEATLRQVQLHAKEQALSLEKEKRYMTESHLRTESSRRAVEDRFKDPPSYAGVQPPAAYVPSYSPNRYSSAMYKPQVAAASVRSASRQSMSLS